MSDASARLCPPVMSGTRAVPRLASCAAILALAVSFAPAAHANFPNCQPELPTPNPPLNPQPNGTYTPDPALPYAGRHTVWNVLNGLEIQQTIGNTKTAPFIVNGVDYEPTQIGGSAGFPPYNDFFFTNDVSTYAPLWARDIETLRDIGVNSIRTYGFWKFEPGFNGDAPGNTGVAHYWDMLDFKATPNQKNDQQFCLPGNDSIYAFEHRSHLAFLDKLWNNGKNPIYVWIGISLPLEMIDANTPPGERAQYRQFYRHTAKWLAKMYGNHPAVMGFVIGNELDTAATAKTALFWDTLDDIGQVVKASAPDKLTMSVFHDTPDFNSVVQDAPGRLRGPQIYNLDVWAFNPYTNPAPAGNLFNRFYDDVVKCKEPNGTSCEKPLLFGEFGVPGDTHKSDPELSNNSYPNLWTGVNFIWSANPPAPQCLTPDQLGPPPGPGGKGPRAEYKAGRSIGIELAPYPVGRYDMPATLASRFPGYPPGTPLGAGAQADWINDFLATASAYRVDVTAPPSDYKFNSGGFVFEWRDEWWKTGGAPPYFQTIGGADECPPGCTGGCDTGAANVVFPGGWGDEEWFGVTGAAPKGRKPSDPVINQNTGKLNGGPDTLEPRAALVAMCKAFGGSACP